MTLSLTARWCIAIVLVGLLLLGFALEPARGPQSTFTEERLPR